MKLGLREWWALQSGGNKIVWAIVLIGFLLYFSGNLNY